MIPERSVQASSAKSVFFEELNDIDIYIEDTAFGYSKLFLFCLHVCLKVNTKLARFFL